MLVLSRKKNESIVINNDITVTVVEIRGDKVRLGIVAPKEVPVHRQEVFDAIHEGDADSKLLAYQYLQMLPEIAKTDSNKIWFVPTEFTGALKAVAAGFGYEDGAEPLKRDPGAASKRKSALTSALEDPRKALEEARRLAEGVTADAESHGTGSGKPFDPEAEKGQAPPA